MIASKCSSLYSNPRTDRWQSPLPSSLRGRAKNRRAFQGRRIEQNQSTEVGRINIQGRQGNTAAHRQTRDHAWAGKFGAPPARRPDPAPCHRWSRGPSGSGSLPPEPARSYEQTGRRSQPRHQNRPYATSAVPPSERGPPTSNEERLVTCARASQMNVAVARLGSSTPRCPPGMQRGWRTLGA